MGNCGQGMYQYSIREEISLLTHGQERSLSKRKEMWRTIQIKANNRRPVQLILDMKVRWSSMYLMLDCVERKKNVRCNFPTKIQILIHFS